jgi:NitT/TauT family transport system substrate-binding protein
MRFAWLSLLTIVVACTPAAAPTPTAAPTAPPAALEHVKFANTTGSATAAPVYIAEARGYFQQQGIELEVVPFGGGAQMISSIAASQVDVANTDSGAGLINAMARNLPMRFAADGSRCQENRCNSALTVRKDLGDSGAFKDLSDLRGLNVNTFTPGSTLNMYSYRTLEKAGLQKTDMKEQSFNDFSQILPAFVSKSIDATYLIEPFTTQGVSQGALVKFKDTSQILGPQQSTVIVYAPTFATQRQEAGKKFMVAYIHGVRDFLDAFDSGKDQDQIVSILTSSTLLKDPAQWKNVPQTFDANGAILLDALKFNQQWYVEHGAIPTPVDLDQVWDPTYTDYAISVLGKR